MLRFNRIVRNKWVLTGCASAVVGGAGLTFGTSEGTKRSMQFWANAFPVYLTYRTVQLLNRDLQIMSDDFAMQQYDVLHEFYTDKVKDLVYRMRGFYLKNAQILSTQDDFVPPAYMRWVKDTQDKVPSEFEGRGARDYCAQKMKEELGLEFDEIFSYWQDEPLGTASIGQVHKAVLKATGETVAVKILCPNIEEKFRADIQTLKSFCALAMPQHLTAFNEIEKQFCTEFDYVEEGKNLDFIQKAITPKWGNHVVVPKPHLTLCSRHILVMQYLEGVKLVDGIREKFSKLAALQGRTLQDLENEQKDLIMSGKFKFKTIEEASREQSRTQWLLFLKDVTNPVNVSRFFYNTSMFRFIYGPADYERSEAPIDLGKMLDLLCNVHGNELFEHGAFNGDPHPGNILLLTDGRLGLIDYGQVKRMTVQERIIYAKLIMALSRDDKKEIIRIHFEEIGTKTKKMDPEIGFLMASFYNDRDTPDITQGMNIQSFIDWMQSQDPMERLPEEFLFASRINIMLRGLGKAFGLKLRMSKQWENEARAFLKSQNINY